MSENKAVAAADDSTSSSDVNITLRTSDDHEFVVKQSIAMRSITIKNYLEDGNADSDILVPLPNVTADTLSVIIDYLNSIANFEAEHDPNSGEFKDAVRAYKENFVKKLKDESGSAGIINMIQAANYLHIADLLDFLCQAIADHIKDMKVEEVRDFFGVVNDFTPEEEEQIRQETEWAFK